MRTVGWLKAELSKFKDSDTCFAYEGEICGIIVERKDATGQGIIYCAESNNPNMELDTEELSK